MKKIVPILLIAWYFIFWDITEGKREQHGPYATYDACENGPGGQADLASVANRLGHEIWFSGCWSDRH
jgi:hypothetical protein